MVKQDLRKLGIAVQEDIRVKVLAALDGGMRKKDVMSQYGISDAVIYKWLEVRKRRGADGLKQEKRGRPSQTTKLTKAQQLEVVKVIYANCPDEVDLPFPLWTRAAVHELLKNKFEVVVSKWTIDRYLRSWGFTPQEYIHKLYIEESRYLQQWMKEKMPGIRMNAKNESAQILWCDEMGKRSDQIAWPSIKVVEETDIGTTVVRQRQLKMILTLTDAGHLKYMFYRGRFTAKVFIDFMSRLIKNHRRKVFILVDFHDVFMSDEVSDWISQHADHIKLFKYSGHRSNLK